MKLAERLQAATVDITELRQVAKVGTVLWDKVVELISNGEGGLTTVADFGFCHPKDVTDIFEDLDSSLDRVRVGLLFDLCRNACGLSSALVTTDDGGAGIPAAPAMQDPGNRLKLSHFIDGLADGTFPLMSQEDYEQYLIDLRLKYGDVQEECVPTRQQLSGVKHLIDANDIPFCDLCIYTGNQRDRLRSLRQSALRLDEDGEVRRATVSRTPSFSEWNTNFRIYSTTLVMLGVAHQADLMKYADNINGLYKVYGSTYWPQIYSADEHLRSARLSRYLPKNGTWGDAFVAGARDSTYWMERVDRVVFQLQRAASTSLPSGDSKSRKMPRLARSLNDAGRLNDVDHIDQLTVPNLGGLRNPYSSTLLLPDGIVRFRQVRESFESILLESVDLVNILLTADNPMDYNIVNRAIDKAGNALIQLVGGQSDLNLPSHPNSPVKGRLLKALVDWVGDWVVDVPSWFIDGAPVGLLSPIIPRGVFAVSDGPSTINPTDFTLLEPVTSADDCFKFQNYPSAENDIDKVLEVLKAEEKLKFCKICYNFDEVKQLVCSNEVVLTPIAAVPKANGSLRLISDCKINHLNQYCCTNEHMLLPRVGDLVDDILSLSESARKGSETVETVVIDFTSAFRSIPLKLSERRYHVMKIGSFFVVYFCLFYGLSSSPLLWGRTAAMLSRFGQLLFASVDGPIGHIEMFVDDPAVVTRGPTAQIAKVRLCLPILLWLAMGFILSFSKRQVGYPFRWIGFTINLTNEAVLLSLPIQKLEDLCERVAPLLFVDARISLKSLRKLCGKLSFAAQVVPYLRSFVAPLCSKLAVAEKLGLHRLVIKDLLTTLKWIWCFLNKSTSSLKSNGITTYLRAFPLNKAIWSSWSICVDASPTGLGGVLYHDTRVVAWFADELSSYDYQKFDGIRGDCKRQAVWESLAILVAVRLWSARVPSNAIFVCESDSKTALSVAMTLRSKSMNMNCIAQELALHCAVSGKWYNIQFSHIKGIENQLADTLSRLSERQEVPRELRCIPRCWQFASPLSTNSGMAPYRRGNATQAKSLVQPKKRNELKLAVKQFDDDIYAGSTKKTGGWIGLQSPAGNGALDYDHLSYLEAFWLSNVEQVLIYCRLGSHCELIKLHVEDVELDEANRVVTIHVRESKTDIQAIGSRRCHGCACEGSKKSEMEKASPEDCLIVDHPIGDMTKKKMLGYVRSDLQRSGAITKADDLSAECFGTHSFRRGGTQFLIRYVSWEKVQAFGRWKSAASMQKYVEEANLVDSDTFARVTVQQWNQSRPAQGKKSEVNAVIGSISCTRSTPSSKPVGTRKLQRKQSKPVESWLRSDPTQMVYMMAKGFLEETSYWVVGSVL
ncbi:hypothetical protein FOL47_007316 [Perkinsus chesapeaki]|uniref:Reverse transcriptase domain-containing protein n=1 Tax=Perkinsus chesapeaki TaxID=330153 RepID=A0A7J6LLB3_PERCH|nr:hypothetical protein FOL47_007316 [Perkinsus chesapeaki]